MVLIMVTSMFRARSLSYDIERSTVREACETVGEEFNKWIRNLRKKYGHISYLRGWESTSKGYPHIHVLMIFHDYRFRIAFSQLKRTKYGSYRRVYRIEEKEELEKSYRSFVDVEENITLIQKTVDANISTNSSIVDNDEDNWLGSIEISLFMFMLLLPLQRK